MLDALILDATPLITQTAAQLKPYARAFFTTPGVHSELKDENSKNQLVLWGDALVVRHPKQKYIDMVWDFARKTGDNQVLSINDVHVIALAAEIHDSLAKDSPDRLRKFPGELREIDQLRIEQYKQWKEKEMLENPDRFKSHDKEEVSTGPIIDDDGFEVVVSKKKNNKRSNRTNVVEEQPKEREIVADDSKDAPIDTPETETAEEQLTQEYSPEDDDGEWITEDNLQEMVVKHTDNVEAEVTAKDDQVLCALSTGDYACQNVSLQMGLHLLNAANGKQVKRIRNYMLRCHACFEMYPIPKDGSAKQFCGSCGGATLRRIPVSVNSESGKVTPHLSKNFQWITRGNVYSTPNPLSKRYQKKYGNKGYNHVKGSMENDYYSEDQREYQQALKSVKYQMQKHQKEMMDYVSSGSAENVISPFSTGGSRTIKVKVGRGRYANMSKRK